MNIFSESSAPYFIVLSDPSIIKITHFFSKKLLTNPSKSAALRALINKMIRSGTAGTDF